MKLRYIIFIVFFITSNLAFTQESNIELGARFLKLGNTYMNSKNYEVAKSYLDKGMNLVKGKSKYWEAVANEYMGYYYLNAEGDRQKAIEHLNKAQLLFKEVISQKDGSQEAVGELMDMMQYLSGGNGGNEPKAVAGYSNSRKNNGEDIFNYDNQKLRDLPQDLPPNLKNLSMSGNKFRDFPSGLLEFKQIKYLNLENNKIKSLPENIDDMKSLEYLNLSGNKIKKLPAGLCNMKNLKMLDLKKNKISFEDISNLIRCLPNTNILFDEYILKPEETEEESIQELE